MRGCSSRWRPTRTSTPPPPDRRTAERTGSGRPRTIHRPPVTGRAATLPARRCSASAEPRLRRGGALVDRVAGAVAARARPEDRLDVGQVEVGAAAIAAQAVGDLAAAAPVADQARRLAVGVVAGPPPPGGPPPPPKGRAPCGSGGTRSA